MSKVVVVPVTGAQNLTAINDNFETLADVLNNQVLFRTNPEGEPNEVTTDVDMNNRRIYNLPQPISPSEPVRYQDLGDVTALTETARGYAEDAEASAQAASISLSLAQASATSSAGSAAAASASSSSADAAQEAAELAASQAAASAASIDPAFLRNRTNHTGTQDITSTTTGTLTVARGGTGATTALAAFDALKQAGTEAYAGVSQFSTAAENVAGAISNKAVDPLGIREAFNATGTAPIYACRAWVNFNGTGTVAIRASGNVSSVTDNGTGDYTINLTTPLPDANYSVSGTAGAANGAGSVINSNNAFANSTTQVSIGTRVLTGSAQPVSDFAYICVAVFR